MLGESGDNDNDPSQVSRNNLKEDEPFVNFRLNKDLNPFINFIKNDNANQINLRRGKQENHQKLRLRLEVEREECLSSSWEKAEELSQDKE